MPSPDSKEDPLHLLFQSIQDAKTIPDPALYQPDKNDPIFKLIHGGKKSIGQQNAPKAASVQSALLSDLTRRSILSRDLRATSRLEATDLAIAALENPSREKIEAILHILISG